MKAIFHTHAKKTIHTELFHENHRIHVLDLNVDGAMSVTNGIDEIQPDILKTLHLSGAVSDYEWILYGTDGIVSRFDRGTFSICPEEKHHLPFYETCQRYRS